MNLSTKIAYNTIIQFISKIISTVVGLLAMAMMARYLGVNGFGEYTTAITFISFFAIIADLGLTLVTVQMISEPNIDEDKVLGNLLGLRLVSALIIIGAGPLIAIFSPYSTEIKLTIALSSFSFFFTALSQVLIGFFQKRLRMDKVSIADVASRLVMILGLWFSIKSNLGLRGIAAIISFSGALNFLILYFASLPFTKIKLHFDISAWKVIVNRSWPLALTIVFNLIYLKTDTLLLSIMPRPSQMGIIAEVGLYGAAYKVIDVLITFPFIFAGIILPILTSRFVSKDLPGFFSALQRSFDIMVILAFPIIVGTYFVAEKVITLVAGPQFSQAGSILRILIIAAAIIFPGTMFSHAIIAVGKQKKIIFSYFFVAISSVIGYFIFIPRFSYFGAAWVTIYSEACIAGLMFFLVWKYTKFMPKLNIALKALVASLLMGLVIFFLNKYQVDNIFITILLGISSYFIFLYLLKGLDKNNLLSLINKE